MDIKGIKAYLGDLLDVDLTSNPPTNNDLLMYNSTNSTWIPSKANLSGQESYGVSYRIELDKWNIKNDGTNPLETTIGINNAIIWAKENQYDHVILPEGYYKLRMNSSSFSCIVVPSNIHFEMSDNTHIELEMNSSPFYRVIDLTGVKNVKISGGKITGDKKFHIYELGIKFTRGGVNSDGSLNNDPNFIRSEVIDRYNDPGLLRAYRLWRIPGITTASYSFYQYQDTVSSNTLKGVRNNGGFAPANPNGRGWFGQIEEVNKMIFVIDISSSTLTDAEISAIRGKVDSQSYTHEFGHGIEIKGCTNIEVTNVEISDCTGDAIYTGWLEYKLDPSEYTQEQIGSRIFIHNSNLHHCRRQGVSLGAPNDVYVYNNKIHHIGYADDGITVDGTSPMFGIDIESQWSESNIPTWRPELNQEGFEINTRIYIFNNYIFNNAKGHFVNADGINIVVESNTFEGYNVGGISSFQSNWYIKYINNTFIRCELTVKGDNFVNGVFCYKGNVKLQDIRGAHISNCTIKEGLFYGSSNYGYFGTPISVDIETGTYRYNTPHGMGNGAKISFRGMGR